MKHPLEQAFLSLTSTRKVTPLYLCTMSASAETTTQERQHAPRDERPPLTGPASEAQRRALHRFGCDLPPNLGKQAASDWMDWIIEKVRAGGHLSPQDVSGPPSFAPVASPGSPVSPAATPAPPKPPEVAGKGPDPAGNPPSNGHEPYAMVSAWVPLSSMGIMLEAIKKARGYVG